MQNKKERKIHKRKELAEIKMNLLNQNAISLGNIELTTSVVFIKERSIFYTNTKRCELV